MPQKQPPATTAVRSALVVASVASTAGFGTVAPARSPALQATTPARITIKSTADMREGKLNTVNSFDRLGSRYRALLNRVAPGIKVTNLDCGAPGVLARPGQGWGPRWDGRDARRSIVSLITRSLSTSSCSACRESNPAGMLRRRGSSAACFFLG